MMGYLNMQEAAVAFISRFFYIALIQANLKKEQLLSRSPGLGSFAMELQI